MTKKLRGRRAAKKVLQKHSLLVKMGSSAREDKSREEKQKRVSAKKFGHCKVTRTDLRGDQGAEDLR